VYRLPGAGFAEKDGTFVNSARWLQWKNVAVPPPGQARLDQEILATIFLKVRELYKKEGGKFPRSDSERVVRLHESVQSVAVGSRERNQRQSARDLTDPKTNITIKPASNFPALPG
jgi:anaerobic selenocysteine-containing dehydrogenase